VDNNIWAADKSFIINYLETLANASFNDKQTSLFGLEESEEDPNPSILSIEGNTALIKIQGILTKDPLPAIARFFGFTGTTFDQILEAAAQVLQDGRIENVRLIMNTPGGEAAGTDEASQAIAELAKKKHVVAENHALIASGGYWIASQAGQIVSISPANMTGSIGVIVTGWDFSKAHEKMGVKRVIILSKNAPQKGGTQTPAGRAGIQDTVDALERVFIQRISEGRGIPAEQIEKTFGRGGVLVAQDPDEDQHDALSVGMIDSVVVALGKTVTPEGNASSNIINDNGSAVAEPIEITNNSAIADNSLMEANMELKDVKLSELLASSPDAKKEHDAALATAKAEGVTEGTEQGAKQAEEAITTRITGCTPFLTSDKYPQPIQDLAVKVLNGESDVAALTSAASAHDATVEAAASAAAAGESKKQPETVQDDGQQVSTDGHIRSEDDFALAVKQARGEE